MVRDSRARVRRVFLSGAVMLGIAYVVPGNQVGAHEIAVDSTGNIYTVDGYSRTVQRYLFTGVPSQAGR
jgi:hypothetical protein